MDEGPVIINVAKDFSLTPGPRYVKQGPFSGEAFRKKVLVPALTTGSLVCVVFDGTAGFGSSFIDEAFGGLVRSEGYKQEELLSRISYTSVEDPILIDDAIEAIKDARPA